MRCLRTPPPCVSSQPRPWPGWSLLFVSLRLTTPHVARPTAAPQGPQASLKPLVSGF